MRSSSILAVTIIGLTWSTHAPVSGAAMAASLAPAHPFGTLAALCGVQGEKVRRSAFDAAERQLGPAHCAPGFGQQGSIAVKDVSAAVLAPGNLRATVTGSTVRLDWDVPPEPIVSFLLEAGSAPGLRNLAAVNTGSAAPTLTATNVPNGVYYLRVRSIGPDGIPGPASNEIVVRVGAGGCRVAPSAPAGLTAQVLGNQVTLSWFGPTSGDAPTTYILEAGSAPGLSNLAVVDTGSAATQVVATAPPGVYHVRVRARNACGTSAASNEFQVIVGTPPTPGPGGTAPVITSIGSPGVVSGATGGRGTVTVRFTDPDADIIRLDVTVVSSPTPFTASSLDPNVRGRTQGAFDFFVQCSRGPCSGTTTLELVLVDARGNRSAPARFSFTYQ